MPQTDLILVHPASTYDSREATLLRIPYSGASSLVEQAVNPVDFLAIAGELTKAGHSVRIVDLAFSAAHRKHFNRNSFIKKLDAQIFAIEMTEMSQAAGALKTAQLIKKHHPTTRTIFFGCAAASFHNELIMYPHVDGVINGTFNAASATTLIAASTSLEFNKVPGLLWKKKHGRVRRNDFLAEIVYSNLNITEYYRAVTGQILHFRDFAGVSLLMERLLNPRVSIFKNDCGGTPAFREPEDVYLDIVETCRFSHATVSIRGDIRTPGERFAEDLLSLLQHYPVSDQIKFNLVESASPFFIQEIARASPGFRLIMAPGSHDVSVREALGHFYSNQDLESTIEAALKARTSAIEILFLCGLPGQTTDSIMHTIDYCERLFRHFDGDRRLSVSINPYSPLISCSFCERPEIHSFMPRFHTFEDHLKATTLPGWSDRLEYSTAEMSSEQIALTTYEALINMVRLKAKYGQLSYRKAQDMAANYTRGMEMTKGLNKLVRSGNMDELTSFRPEIERINACEAQLHRQPRLSLMFSRPQNLVALFNTQKSSRRLEHRDGIPYHGPSPRRE